MKRCTKHKKNGEPCNQAVSYKIVYADCCYYHGGRNQLSDEPIGGRPTEHFLYSRHLKGKDLEAYLYHRTNPDMLNLDADIALARTNLGRFLDTLEGQRLTSEVREHVMRHLDLISRMADRDAKRRYQELIVTEGLGRQAGEEAAILSAVLAEECDQAQAERIMSKFAAKLAASGTKVSINIGG